MRRIALRLVLTIGAPLVLAAGASGQTNYYWNGSGSITSTASWGTNLDGSGTQPTNFTTANQIFNFQNGQSATATATWTISGAGSRLQILSGGQFTTGSFNHSLTLGMDSGALYAMNHTTYGALTFGTLGANSTFRLDNQQNPRAAGIAYGNLVFNGTSNVSMGSSQNLNVAGTLQVSNSGELRLTGASNLTHAVQNVTIDATRTLNLVSGAGNMTLNIAGDLTNSGTISKSGNGPATIAFTGAASSNATWGNVTAAAASISIATGRTVAFLDTLSTTGTRTLTNNGTLNLGNGGTTGSVNGDFANNGSLVVDRSNAISLNGSINGSGSLTKQGAGTLTLTNGSNYTGGTFVNAGTLALGTSDALFDSGTLTVSGGSTFSIDTNSDSIGAITLANGSIAGTTGSLNGTSYDVRSGDVTAILGENGPGVAMTKTTAGTVTLSGANNYTGGTSVTAGTLLVNNATGSGTGTGAVDVGSGGTLGGNGTITPTGANTVTVNGSGTITAGTGVADPTLAIGANGLTLNAGAAYSVKLFDVGTTDISLLQVTGTATIDAAADVLLDLSALSSGQVNSLRTTVGVGNSRDYTVLSATAVSGGFTSLTIGNLGNFAAGEWTLANGGTGGLVVLRFTPVPEPATAVALFVGGVGAAEWLRRRRPA